METRAVIVALVLAAAMVLVPLGAAQVADVTGPASTLGAAATTDAAPQDGNAGAENVSPGARLAGVVGAQGVGLDGVVERKALDARLNAANSSDAKAGVIAGEYDSITAKLDALREKQDALVASHENGSLSTGAYHARAATLAAEIRNLERLANTTAEAAKGLPESVLEERGVNVTAIERLRTDARNLTGQSVADIARTIGGAGTGQGPPDGVVTGPSAGNAPDDAGPPEDQGPVDRGTADESEDGTTTTDETGNTTSTADETGDTTTSTSAGTAADGSEQGDGTDGGTA